MAEEDIRRLTFLKIKANAKELNGNLKVSASTVKEINALIAQAPKGSTDEEVAQGVFSYLKENQLFTAKGQIKGISTRSSAPSIEKKVEQAKKQREEKEASRSQETQHQEENERTSEQSSTASKPRTPATVAEAEQRYNPARVIGAMASIAAKDRADAIRDIKKQEVLREAAEVQIIGDIQRFREEQAQTQKIIEQKAQKMHKRQTGGTKETVAEITESLRKKAIEEGTLKEDPVKAEEEIMSKVIEEYQKKGLSQKMFITIPDPLNPKKKELVKSMFEEADREAKERAKIESSTKKEQENRDAEVLAAKKAALAKRKEEAEKKRETIETNAATGSRQIIDEEATVRQAMSDALRQAHVTDQERTRKGVATQETEARAKAQEQQEAEWQKEGKERLSDAREQMIQQLQDTVSTGTTLGFGGYKERRNKLIDALVTKYCDELRKDNKSMEALTEDETKALVKANVERMSPKIDKFCKEHKLDQEQDFQQSMDTMVRTTAEHFAETSKAAMSSGRDKPKRYGEATPEDVLAESLTKRYPQSDTTRTVPHSQNRTTKQNQNRNR